MNWDADERWRKARSSERKLSAFRLRLYRAAPRHLRPWQV